MGKSVLEEYIGKKADKYADRVNDDFCQIKNKQIQKMLDVYSNPAQSGSDTPSHAKVTSRLMAYMVDAINTKHPNTFSEQQKQCIVVASMLHDIGKTSIPVSILDKKTILMPDEYDHMKSHTVAGNRIIGKWLENHHLDETQRQTLVYAQQMACFHHERPDGRGYPNGLSNEEIPYVAKMMAVVDVMEALTAQRAYKAPMPLDKAESIIRDGAGTQFDAELVDIFFGDAYAKEEIGRIVHNGRAEKLNAQMTEKEEVSTDTNHSEIVKPQVEEER